MKKFEKHLSANDAGETGGHQAGLLIPKGQQELIEMLPYLDPSIKNPDAWIRCIDSFGDSWELRYIYYNNKFHDEKGTRNEYRITHMTKYLRTFGAKEGSVFVISKIDHDDVFNIALENEIISGKIKLRGWKKVY